MLKISKHLSYTQARKTLLVGKSLELETSSKKIKHYISFLDIIDEIEIRGLAQDLCTRYLQEFIENYFKSLDNILQNSGSSRIKDLVSNTLTTHITEKAELYLNELVTKYKQKEITKVSMIISSWSCLKLSSNISEFLLEILCKHYFDGKKVNLKYERLHLIAFTFFINILKNHQKLMWKHREKTSLIFLKAQSICRKYIQHKNSKERLYILSCEFIVLAVTNTKIIESGLKNITFPAIFGKTCYAESYISYFFKQTYLTLKRSNIAVSLLLRTKEYLIAHLTENQEYIAPALESLKDFLKVAEEAEVKSALIALNHELFSISKPNIISSICIPYIQTCYHEQTKKTSADLISSVIPLVPQKLIKNLDPLFSSVFSSLDQENIMWIKKVAKGLPWTKISEIADNLLIIYVNSYENTEICSEILCIMVELAVNSPEGLLEKITRGVTELLLLHEKLLWVRNQKQDSEIIISRAFSLLSIAINCAGRSFFYSDYSSMNEFWCIIIHFHIQYPLKDIISIADLNESLDVIAKITPYLLKSDQKEMPSVFLHLFQAPNYTKSFLPKLKSYLSQVCSKR